VSGKQVYQVFCGLAVLLSVGLVVSVYFGMTMLEESSEELQTAKVQQEVTEAQELSLIQAKADVEEYSELEELATRIIPQEKDQARTVREVIAIAQDTGVSVSTVSFPSSNLGAAQASSQSVITQATPVQGIPGLLELEMSVGVSESPTTYDRFISFLDRLEQNRRTSQVQSISIIPDEDNRSLLTFTVNLVVYIKP